MALLFAVWVFLFGTPHTVVASFQDVWKSCVWASCDLGLFLDPVPVSARSVFVSGSRSDTGMLTVRGRVAALGSKRLLGKVTVNGVKVG